MITYKALLQQEPRAIPNLIAKPCDNGPKCAEIFMSHTTKLLLKKRDVTIGSWDCLPNGYVSEVELYKSYVSVKILTFDQ